MGAVSVVNAIASGRGATVAVRLRTRARVEVEQSPGEWDVALNGRFVGSTLAQETVAKTMLAIGLDPSRHSGSVETTTEAPVGVGLKTSSSSSVAISMATLAAFGRQRYAPHDILGYSVSASLASGVSATGALDDAASCLMGGANFTDNLSRKVLSSQRLGKPLTVLIRVPQGRSRRKKVSLRSVRTFSKEADEIFRLGKRGKVWNAMTLNGFLYCSIYGYDPLPATQALEAGALGAGLSGTGPAVAAVFGEQGEPDRLEEAWSDGGANVIVTQTTDEGATFER
ncbi:MAG: shikimate kinase [Thaumarchaeota archaeon]|nr:shikimate kinase [Nitrososphaerota archaeon]